jgi:hypothetical protein
MCACVGEKRKRRIEDLERWRDVALALTSNGDELDVEDFEFSNISRRKSTIIDTSKHSAVHACPSTDDSMATSSPCKLTDPSNQPPNLSLDLADIALYPTPTSWTSVNIPDASLDEFDFDLGQEDYGQQVLQSQKVTPGCCPSNIDQGDSPSSSNSTSITVCGSTADDYASPRVRIAEPREFSNAKR